MIIKVSRSKATKPATYKQMKYLLELGVDLQDSLSMSSRFTKFVSVSEASEAIEAALAGHMVIIKHA